MADSTRNLTKKTISLRASAGRIQKSHDKLRQITNVKLSDDNQYQIAEIPSIIKYMGSKKPILNFIVTNIEGIHIKHRPVCDLFAGSCTISAALRKKFDFISNDIQEYSSVMGQTYFSDLSGYNYSHTISAIQTIVENHIEHYKSMYSEYFYDYSKIHTLEDYQKIELKQRQLASHSGFNTEYHLFAKHYSGTYWSFEQCVCIDAMRKAADHFKNKQLFYPILASIMYSMSYTTQSTGHFAQYRDGNTLEAMTNIKIYRAKNIFELFTKKLKELMATLDNSLKEISTTTLSFQECLKLVPEGATVYADPPYAPVHYSRFYHVLETLVKYDYPSLLYKGRYREDRHQSPFSQKSKALEAFKELFDGICERKLQMVLSYSGSGVVTIESIIKLAESVFDKKMYILESKELDHKHSTMGRFEDHNRDVTEYLLIAKFI